MPTYRVGPFGDGYTVFVDEVPTTQYTRRVDAVKACMHMKENDA